MIDSLAVKLFEGLEAEKAISLSTLGTAGVLEPNYRNQFVQDLYKNKTILNDARIQQMTSDKEDIDRTGFTGRVLQPMVEGQALANESNPAFNRNQLIAVEVGAQTSVNDKVLRRNIERKNFTGTLTTMLANASGVDREVAAIFGDTTNSSYSSTPGASSAVLKITNGWIKKAATGQKCYGIANGGTLGTNPGDFDGSDIQDTFDYMIEKYPKQYVQNWADLRFYVGWDLFQAFRSWVMSRQTVVGDNILTNNWTPVYLGTPVVYCPSLDDTDGVSAFGHVAILVNPDNLVAGILEDVTIEPQRSAPARSTSFTLCMEIDQHYENENAVVIAFTDVQKPT